VEDELGAGVDILVNNAAAPRTFHIGYLEMTREVFVESVEVNAWAAWELGALVAAGMRDRGRGWILNISSRAAGPKVGPPYQPSQVRRSCTDHEGDAGSHHDRRSDGLYDSACGQCARARAAVIGGAATLISVPKLDRTRRSVHRGSDRAVHRRSANAHRTSRLQPVAAGRAATTRADARWRVAGSGMATG
jgi:hypothetical protein